MADVIKEYVLKITTEGSKIAVKEFKDIEQVEKKQNKNLKETNSLLWTYAKRLVGIYAIYKMINKGIGLAVNFAEQGNALKNLSTVANVSTKSLEKWGYVLRRFGGNEKTVASTIGNINRKLYERQYGQEPFKEYVERYGALPAGKNAEDFLIGIAKKMEQYSNMQTKLDIADKLNLDDAMTNFLLQGSKAVQSQLKNASALFTDEDIATATKAKEELIKFNRQLERLANVTGKIVLKPLTDVIVELTEFLKDPKKYIANTFRDTNTSAYGVAKDMFSYKTASSWIADRLAGLTNFSSTTGLDTAGSLFSGLSNNVLGKGNVTVYNDIDMSVTGADSEEISNNVVGKLKETTATSYNEALGVK